MAKTMMTFEEAERHAGSADWEQLEDRAKLALPAYLWTYRRGKTKWLYCSRCYTDTELREMPCWVAADPYVADEDSVSHQEWEHGLRGPARRTQWKGKNALDGSGRHGHFGRCPACGEIGQYRSLYMGRKTLEDRIFYIRYRQSAAEERALVMTGWLVTRRWADWDEMNDREPEIDISLREVCVFRPGLGGERFTALPCLYGDMRPAGLVWRRMTRCKGGFDPIPGFFNCAGTAYYLDQESVDAAVQGTKWDAPLQALVGEPEYDELLDLVNPLRFIAQWPCAEYLAKLGLGGLIKAAYLKTDGGCVNLRGKTARSVLRVNGDDWGWIKGHREECTVSFMRILQRVRRENRTMGCRLIAEALRQANFYALERVLDATRGAASAAALRYCVKRRINPGDYADYLEQIAELGMDTDDRSILYPQDFAQEHRRLSERIQHKKDQAKDKQIEKNLEKLGMYWFSALGLTLRPMASSGEIIREGQLQHNCVGSYVGRYAEGRTVLLCLREDERLDKPYRTVEFSTAGQMVQCYGRANKNPPEEQPRIDEFWRLYGLYRRDYDRAHAKARRAAV